MSYLKIIETSFIGKPWTYAKVSEQLIIILPITKDGRFVCISQARPTFEKRVLSPVMGTFHENDPIKLIETAAIEVKSETGHKANEVKYLMSIARSPGLTDETAHLYSATVDNICGEQELHSEDIEVIYFSSLVEMKNEITKGQYIIDASLPYFLSL